MAKKSLPNHPLTDFLESRTSSVAEASTELALHQKIMAGAYAITLEQLGKTNATLSAEIQNAEVPPGLLEVYNDIISHANDPAHSERVFAGVLPKFITECEQRIINIENIRGDLYPETIVNRAIVFNSYRKLLAAILSCIRKEKTLQALVVVMDGLEAINENPIVKDAPWVSDFVATMIAEVGRSIDPHEVIASIAKTTGATKAANTRHAKSAEIRLRVAKEWGQRKSKNPKLSKNKAAEGIAPLAIEWNIELDAKLLTLTTEEKAKAQVRDWLQDLKTAI
jgi:hypothetical protein